MVKPSKELLIKHIFYKYVTIYLRRKAKECQHINLRPNKLNS